MNLQPIITPRDLECILCDETAEPQALPLTLLEEITDGFSDEMRIGIGGFAVVYKGMLENMTVAVKRMSNVYMDEKVFHREVECLMMVKHKNIVRFLGYCADRQGSMEMYNGKFVMADVNQRLLCFDYLPKGSLDNYITDTSHILHWRYRYQIIMGVCKGLHYLHQKNIVHLDLKPANILLDNNLVPKLTDFGISRCFHEIESEVITTISGTFGYMAPESFNGIELTYQNSYRLDIYSLGVVIMEILTGEKGYHDVENVVEIWSNKVKNSQSVIELKQVRVCAEIGIECIDSNPAKRPETQDIINRLDEKQTIDGYIENCANTSRQEDSIAVTMTGKTPFNSLWMSYLQLNSDIRECIEYCTIFPKGSILRKNDLVRLWIAQGFVKTFFAAQDKEHVAEGYIQELVSCSFLQEGIANFLDSNEDYFTMLDVLHDLLDKVTVHCFRIENSVSKMGQYWEGDVPRDVQHLFVQNYDAKLITETILRLENLHTLIIDVVGKDTFVEEKVVGSICKSLPKLRVLAVAFSKEHDPIKQPVKLSIQESITRLESVHYLIKEPNKFFVPESVSQLKNLRYLSFRTSCECTVILPSTLSKLQYIQLLDFGACINVEFSCAELIKLRHIICGLNAVCPNNIGRLISLRTIPLFRVKSEEGYEVTQLSGLNKLRGYLRIIGLQNIKSKEEALEANLPAKKGLTGLILLRYCEDNARRSPEVEADVLEGLCPPMGLKKLEVYGYAGSRYPNWMVGTQNSGPRDLQELLLWDWSQPGPAPQLVQAFPHLRVFYLYRCSWDALPGNMEHLMLLKKLVIRSCKNIRSLPTLPQSLEEFRLGSSNDELMSSCRKFGHPNWQRIKHIPYIGFF